MFYFFVFLHVNQPLKHALIVLHIHTNTITHILRTTKAATATNPLIEYANPVILWIYFGYIPLPPSIHFVCVWGGGATDDVAAVTANADSTYTSLITYWQPYEIEMLTRPSAPAWLAGWMFCLPASPPPNRVIAVRSFARSFLRFIYNMKPAISSLVEWNAYGHMECIHQIHLWVQYQYNHHSHLYKKNLYMELHI